MSSRRRATCSLAKEAGSSENRPPPPQTRPARGRTKCLPQSATSESTATASSGISKSKTRQNSKGMDAGEFFESYPPEKWNLHQFTLFCKASNTKTLPQHQIRSVFLRYLRQAHRDKTNPAHAHAERILQKYGNAPPSSKRARSSRVASELHLLINGTTLSTSVTDNTDADLLQNAPSPPLSTASEDSTFESLFRTGSIYLKLPSSAILEEKILAYLLKGRENKASSDHFTYLEKGILDGHHYFSRWAESGFLLAQDLDYIRSLLKWELEHNVVKCVEGIFRESTTLEAYCRRAQALKHSCQICMDKPTDVQIYINAVTCMALFLANHTACEATPLEGNFDNLWTAIINFPLMMSHGTLHRKEKLSKSSNYKFDGLFKGGKSDQEWLVCEVGRETGDGPKQERDRDKVLGHMQIMALAKCQYLENTLQLRGETLLQYLPQFSVWGICCQGLEVAFFKLTYVSPRVGILSTFNGKLPSHLDHLSSLYMVLGQVQSIRAQLHCSLVTWDSLHTSQKIL